MAHEDPILAAWLRRTPVQRATDSQAGDFANGIALDRFGNGSKHNAEYQRVMNLIRPHIGKP